MTTQTLLERSPYVPSHSRSTSAPMSATDFAMPVQHFTASPSQYTLYGAHSQQVSPVNSATATPNNQSPTSPRTSVPPHIPVIGRQLRQPKSPLYVPAVLRPTDFPRRAPKPSPLTPPQSTQNSFDSLENTKTLNRRSTGDSGKFGLGHITEAEFSSEGFGEVTALPSRHHWKPDHESELCDETTCTKYFTYFTRRHHCRRCGNIFCDSHSRYGVPLDQDANFHPMGTVSRSCEHCWHEYNSWRTQRTSRSNSESSTEDSQAVSSTPTIACTVMGMRGAMGNVFGQRNNGGQPESVSASVPRDWHWSTF